MLVTSTTITNGSILAQAPIVQTSVNLSLSLDTDTTRQDRQFTDSPVLPKRQARMALNAISSRRKDGALPIVPAYLPKANEEVEVSETLKNNDDAQKIPLGNVRHLVSSDQTSSPKLPPPNKRKASILKDGVGSKCGDKNVIINEVTNTKHHYDPLEKVRADAKKLEQALISTKIEYDNCKKEG